MRRRRFLWLLGIVLPVGLAVAGTLQVWPQIEGLPNFSVGLPDTMNGQHPMDRESYGEGWFWLGAYSDGSYSFTNFMISNLGPGDGKGTVDMTVWEPAGPTHLRRVAFKAGTLKAATGRLDVRIGENRIWGDYPNFNLKTAEQDVGLDLKYQAQLPGFAINSGRVTYGSTDDFYSVYVTLPRAKITGTVRTPTGTRQVSGFGYSDHGIVTMLPHEYSKRWLTLRCFHSKYTLDFLEFTVPAKWGGQRVAMTIFGAGDKILYGGSRYTLTPSDWRTEPKFKQTYPQRFDFVIDRPGKIKVEGTYTMKTQMHSIDLLSQLTLIERQIASLFAKSYIVRFVAEVDAKVTFPDGTTDSFKSPAVAEVLHLL